jgi:hypothetical protein
MQAVEAAGVVIAVAAQGILTTVGAGQLIPFFASNFAGFAADTNCRIGVESHWFSHVHLPS